MDQPNTMAMCSACASASASLVCRPEEDPFLLLESTLRAVEEILSRRRGLPLRRTWIEQPYGEEEITRLEEEVIPAIQQCLARVEDLDQELWLERMQPSANPCALRTEPWAPQTPEEGSSASEVLS
jgi:hypothetical protein